MSLGHFIKQLREKKELSQRQLSLYSGISNTEISRIENGERKQPSPDTLKALSPHLGVIVDDLMRAAGYIESEAIHNTLETTAAHRSDDPLADLDPKDREKVESYIAFLRAQKKSN